MHDRQSIQLLYTANKPVIWFREITARDELYLSNTTAADAVELVNRLMLKNNDGPVSLTAEKIATADRDRILSRIYQGNFNRKIEASLNCSSCAELFELDFLLADFESHLQQGAIEADTGNEKGEYYLGDDCSFRLPTGEDELAIASQASGKAVNELLNRCLLKGDFVKNGEAVQQTMSQIAPVLQAEMLAHCPECGTDQKIQFDIQTYFLSKIKQEQGTVTREVHRLASFYKWSHAEILDLPRRLRRRYVELIEKETESN